MKNFIIKHKNVLILCVIFGGWIAVQNAEYKQNLRDFKYENIAEDIDRDYENGMIDWCQHQQLMARLDECNEANKLELFYWDNTVGCNHAEIMAQLDKDYEDHDIIDCCEYKWLKHKADSLEAIGQIWQFDFDLSEYIESDCDE